MVAVADLAALEREGHQRVTGGGQTIALFHHEGDLPRPVSQHPVGPLQDRLTSNAYDPTSFSTPRRPPNPNRAIRTPTPTLREELLDTFDREGAVNRATELVAHHFDAGGDPVALMIAVSQCRLDRRTAGGRSGKPYSKQYETGQSVFVGSVNSANQRFAGG